MKNKENRKDYLSLILCMIVGLGMITLLGYHTLKAKPVESKNQTMSYYNHDTITFIITDVAYIEDAGNDTGYKIVYSVNDSTNIELFTSTMEGDYLMYSMDCLALYQDFQDEEEIDYLTSYFVGNSHISYLDNPWFRGFTWTWDSCPTFRYPHP